MFILLKLLSKINIEDICCDFFRIVYYLYMKIFNIFVYMESFNNSLESIF